MVRDPFSEPVRAIEVGDRHISELVEAMRDTAYQARSLGEVLRVWEEAIKARDTVIFLGLAGSMSTAGQWKMVKWLIERRFVDVLVSTGANITEDLVEAMGFRYWKGSPYVNDAELRAMRVYRFHDVFVRESDYLRMEQLLADFMLGLDGSGPYSSAELLFLLGRHLSDRGIDGILTSAYRRRVPVFSPALVDSGFGVAYLLNRHRKKDFRLLVDHFKDFEQIVTIKSRFSDSAAVFIGGGVPKDFIQLAAVSVDVLLSGDLLTTRPHRFAAQVTTDSPFWGGLSGATLEEAVSWGKESGESLKAQCFCDATIALPLLTHALHEKFREGRKGPDLSWVFEEVIR
ncbi:MAG: deoxyhypusine synthase family protein [Nitrososphaerota archaeon]